MRARTLILVGVGAAAVVILVIASVWRNLYTYDAGLEGHYQRTDDPREIVVTAIVGRDDDIVGYSAGEDGDRVLLTVRARRANGSGWSDLVGYYRTVVIRLRDSLAERKVIDVRTGSRMQDSALSHARREVGLIERDSYRASNGAVDLRWTDSKGRHALSDLRGSTVVLLTRGVSYAQQSDSKLNMLALEGYLYNAPDAERMKTFVFVINFDHANAVAPDDAPFRALFADPSAMSAGAPEILQPSAAAVIWFLASDGQVRERIVGAATPEQVARALVAAR